ncbi:MAG: DUF962 domain-containing protein [Planctomycetaceae bacterium]|nr:DUF962 domain-containing protein [Planctomycetaceae bacterium]
MRRPLKTFGEFWPYYLNEHRRRGCRMLHYVGTASGLTTAGVATATEPWLFLATPFAAYGPSWIGHFFVERNRPASFQYPIWSAFADLRMFALAVTGQLPRHLRHAADDPTANLAGRTQAAPGGQM